MCKFAHYGNCDEETKDEEYCIFHKPNKTEEEARLFWKKFLERFHPKVEKITVNRENRRRLIFESMVNAKGFVFPKNPLNTEFFIKYQDPSTNECWCGNFPFENAVFQQGAIFSETTFEGVSSFKNAIFKGVYKKIYKNNIVYPLIPPEIRDKPELISANFENARFLNGATFENAKFMGFVNFLKCKFTSITNFTNVEFKRDVLFTGAEFISNSLQKDIFSSEDMILNPLLLILWKQLSSVVFFIGARFRGTVEFNTAKFEGCQFIHTEFHRDAYFNEAEFLGNSIFTNTKFFQKTDFSRANFDNLVFEHNHLENQAQFTFCEFKDDVDFSSSTFKKETRFDYAIFNRISIFKKVKFKNLVSFDHAEIKRMIDFSETFFEGDIIFPSYINDIRISPSPEYFKNPLSESRAWKVLRKHYEELGERDLADVNFLFERRALRKYRVWREKELAKISGKKNIIGIFTAYLCNFLEFIIADWSCSYGTNWVQPIYNWIVNVLLLFPLLYYISGGIVGASSPWDYWYFSVVTATTLGYGDMHPIGYAKVFASIEAIFGMFMWAVFLTVFARKYMR